MSMFSGVLLAAVFSAGVAAITVTVDPSHVTHDINPLFMGCHSDSGYAHEPRALYSQMIFGASFEKCPDCGDGNSGEWPNQVVSDGAKASFSLDTTTAVNAANAVAIIAFLYLGEGSRKNEWRGGRRRRRRRRQ